MQQMQYTNTAIRTSLISCMILKNIIRFFPKRQKPMHGKWPEILSQIYNTNSRGYTIILQ